MLQSWAYYVSLLLWSVSLPAYSQTQVLRRANAQLESAVNETLGGETPPTALPRVAVPATADGIPRTIEFAAPTAAAETSTISPEVLARWHVRNNLCGQQMWSMQEFQLLFPAITPEMVRQVCSGS